MYQPCCEESQGEKTENTVLRHALNSPSIQVSEESLEVSESSLSMEVIPLTETSQAGIEQSQHIEISSSGQVEDSTEQHSSEAGDGMVEEGAADFSQNEGMHESSVSQGGNSEPEGSVQGWSEEHPDHGELPETTESEQVAGEDSDSEMVLEEQQSISGNEATATEPQASQSSSQVGQQLFVMGCVFEGCVWCVVDVI